MAGSYLLEKRKEQRKYVRGSSVAVIVLWLLVVIKLGFNIHVDTAGFWILSCAAGIVVLCFDIPKQLDEKVFKWRSCHRELVVNALIKDFRPQLIDDPDSIIKANIGQFHAGLFCKFLEREDTNVRHSLIEDFYRALLIYDVSILNQMLAMMFGFCFIATEKNRTYSPAWMAVALYSSAILVCSILVVKWQQQRMNRISNQQVDIILKENYAELGQIVMDKARSYKIARGQETSNVNAISIG